MGLEKEIYEQIIEATVKKADLDYKRRVLARVDQLKSSPEERECLAKQISNKLKLPYEPALYMLELILEYSGE